MPDSSPDQSQADWRMGLAMVASSAAAHSFTEDSMLLLMRLRTLRDLLVDLPAEHPACALLREANESATDLACDSALLLQCLTKAGVKPTRVKLADAWRRFAEEPDAR